MVPLILLFIQTDFLTCARHTLDLYKKTEWREEHDEAKKSAFVKQKKFRKW